MNSISEVQDPAGIASPKRMHVMLVEDSPLIRQALAEALSASPLVGFDGYARTAADAIAILRSRRFDMVVVDIELTEGTGFDVLHAIHQADFPYPQPISMVLTNHAYLIYKHRAQLLGVKYFFDKSMHFDEAIATIEQEAIRLLSGRHSV